MTDFNANALEPRLPVRGAKCSVDRYDHDKGRDVALRLGQRAAVLSVATTMVYLRSKMLPDFTARSSVSVENPRDVAKILLISILLQTFFLFTANYALPGGAEYFFAYADALLSGQKAAQESLWPFLVTV